MIDPAALGQTGPDTTESRSAVPPFHHSASRSAVPSFRHSTFPPFRRSLPPPIIALSPSMRRAVETARRFAVLDLPILLVGPTGTGKEVLAQAIHRWSGRRGDLVDVNCGALPPHTAARELFGHRRGAFTGAVEDAGGLLEAASGGTLFLDELGALAEDTQVHLLRVVETAEFRRLGENGKRTVAVRFLAALQELPGGLREDLRHRLSGGVIKLEPLAARPEDLWPLAEQFAAALERTLSAHILPVLERHSWPGNARELRQVIARAAALQEEGPLAVAAVLEAIDLGAASPRVVRPAPGSPELEALREELAAACRRLGARPDAIAASLGVSRPTLYRRLTSLGLSLAVLRKELAAPNRLIVS